MAGRKKLSKEQREEIYNSLDGHCAYCGCEITLEEMQVDHIVPLRNGGEDVMSNMLPACRSCNHYKHTLSVEKFREAIERMPEVLMRDSVTYKNAVRFGLVKSCPKPVTFYFEKKESDNFLTIHKSKIGQWNKTYKDGLKPTEKGPVCSVCDCQNNWESPYCPMCGTKMGRLL